LNKATGMLNALEMIATLNKGIGPIETPVRHIEVPGLGWNLLREDLSLPAAVLEEDALRHNLAWMRQFTQAYGVKLAPHGKTTMAPQLFGLQLEAGAWGITLATAHQVRVAYAHGVRRVIMANQLVGRQNMTAIAQLLRDPEFDFYCLVDSAEQVAQLGAHFAQAGVRVNVLLELGVDGGRTGVRNSTKLQSVLDALTQNRNSLLLSGVELYEGVLEDEASIRAFLERAVEITNQIAAMQVFQRDPILLSGAGSAWYDVVAEIFTAGSFPSPVEVVLRPGCYLTHDIGSYRRAQERIQRNNTIARRMQSGLNPALKIWAYVQSVPEPEKAIIAMGKRDAAFDSGLPVPALHFRSGDASPKAAPAHWAVTRMMDQHAYLKIAPQDNIHSGDMIAFDIAHPCLTFDKWRILALVNSRYDVIDLIQTYF
jgi:D-serine dehydratase